MLMNTVKAGMLIIVLIVFFDLNEAFSKESSHHAGSHRHKEYELLKNPVKTTPGTLSEAMIIYKQHCSFCHGDSGKGDGEAGSDLAPPAADFTDTVWKHGSSDGEIYNVIANGASNSEMDGWKSDLSKEEMWKLVILLKSFSQ